MKAITAAILIASATGMMPVAAPGEEAAKTMPIADMHFHVMPFMTSGELGEHMDRNGIRWAGGAGGPDGPVRRAEMSGVFGKRYILYTGQSQWVGLKQSRGVAALEDAESPAFKNALERMEKELREGARVIGEIHVNTTTSAANPLLLLKIRADAPTLKAMLDLAAKYKRPLNVHAQWDADTAVQLGHLADANAQGVLLLSHCGVNASASDIRTFFEKHPNVLCDLSFRSPPQVRPRNADRIAFTADSLRGEWKHLIEDFPERFMVGIDDVYNWADYDSVANNIRAGLLANLSPVTAEKVAYKNAVRLFGLE